MKFNLPQKVVITVVLFVVIILSNSLAIAQTGNGYAKPFSVTKGDTINFYISTSAPVFQINISKLGPAETFVGTYSNVSGGIRTVPEGAYETGCRWPVSFSLVIPESWTSGAYAARIPLLSDSAGRSTILFFVKEKQPSSFSKLLVVVPYFTWIANNDFGGKNLYNEQSTGGQRAYRLSLNRPFNGGGYAEFRSWPYKLLNWLDANNIKYELASSLDVHRSPDLLNNYQTVIAVGHDEYYSRAQRRNVENYINRGGKFINLSGNSCWWQVRIEDNDSVLVCYKDRALDPLNGIADSLVTVNWYAPPVNYPENIFLGASFRNAGYVNDIRHTIYTFAQGYGDYGVYNSQHWIYYSTGLNDGDEMGRSPLDSASAIVGYITDGAMFIWKNGLPQVLGTDGTPLNYKILGISPAVGENGIAADHHATMGIYYNQNSGAVFNAATVNWVNGLAKGIAVQKITTNVIKKFMENRIQPEIISWSPSVIVADTINGEIVQVNKRGLEVKANDTTNFTLKVQNPSGETLHYSWYADTALVSTDSVYKATFQFAGRYRITAFVYNSKDTSSINWVLNIKGPVNDVSNPGVIRRYGLEQNYPNPFNPSTTIRYSLASESKVKLTIYNGLGQVVSVLSDKILAAGNYNIAWKADNLASGIYFYSIEASSINGKDNFRSVRKMLLLK